MVRTLADEKKDTTGFGKRLRTLRLAANLTQEGLGDLAGMLHQNIARLERGARTPSWETVLKLAEALGVEPNDFLSDDEPEEEPPASEKKPAPKKPKK